MINRNGYRIIIYNGLLFLILIVISCFYNSLFLQIIILLTAFLFFFNLFFFRDPERNVSAGNDVIISPADGKIIDIRVIDEDKYLHERANMISIFMSIFNVHVNRIPVNGSIEYLEHRDGIYKAAFRDKSSELNEQSLTGIRTAQTKILVKQIAGFIARRIVNNLKAGDKVKAGERFGMVKYGSRLDVIIPLSTEISIQLHEKVKAGETILAKF
jgi:phosphatidylserine decarboxylase